MKVVNGHTVESRISYRTYRDHPGGDWVLLVHGAGGSSRTWRAQIQAFRARYNLILPDLPGHGKSAGMHLPQNSFSIEAAADSLIGMLNSEGIERVHAVGLSLGTIVVQSALQRHPERFASVVHAGGVFEIPRWMNFGLWGMRLAARLLPGRWMYPVLARIVLPMPAHRKSRRVFVREAKKIRAGWLRAWLKASRYLRRILRKTTKGPLEHPTLVISGNQDYLFLPGARSFTRNHNLKLHLLAPSGHVCTIQQPAAFNQACLSFWKQMEQEQCLPHAQTA